MPRLVWLVLQDGRSVVATCDATEESLARAIAEPERTLIVTLSAGVEQIQSSAVRDFVVFDSKADPTVDSAISGRLRL